MHIIQYPETREISERGNAKMKKLSALIGIFILSFGVSILMCTILPYAAIVFIQAALLIAAGVFYILCVR